MHKNRDIHFLANTGNHGQCLLLVLEQAAARLMRLIITRIRSFVLYTELEPMDSAKSGS